MAEKKKAKKSAKKAPAKKAAKKTPAKKKAGIFCSTIKGHSRNFPARKQCFKRFDSGRVEFMKNDCPCNPKPKSKK